MTFAVGENVGPYRIIEQLGQGGMATVYKAYHAGLDRYVAIKALHPAFQGDPGFLARFQREAKAIARLEHPNIVPVYDFSEHDGRPYLVMKFIEGDTLKARMHEGGLSKEEGLRIVEAAGAGLSYAHKRGVLHRDVKPSNILLAPDGSIYLADFGLARIGAESTLSADVMLGTPQYISPEQARGEKDLDAGTDIYSFGVVLYEMVVGRVPFNADTPFSIIHDHIYKPLPIPSQVNPSVPPEVERVLLKSLSKERSDRYATVDDMVAGFRAALLAAGNVPPAASTAPTMAPTPPAPAAPGEPTAEPSMAAPPPKRGPWIWAGVGLAVFCLCAFTFLLLLMRSGREGGGEPSAPEAAQITAPSNSGSVESPVPPAVEEPPAVLEARHGVGERPDDPTAHLALAEALRSHGINVLAAQAYLTAAELFLAQGEELPAAMAALQALQLEGGPGVAGPRAENLSFQAMFLAADNPGIVPLLSDAGKQYMNWDRLAVIAARTALYLGQDDEADRRLEAALDNQPGDPTARAVRAEALYLRGQPVQAENFAREILNQQGVPPWLKDHLNRMIANPPVR